MKKISLVYLTLIFCFLIMSNAFAAQLTFSVGGGVYYAPTTVVSVYTLTYDPDSTVQRIYRYNKFDASKNVSNYPYEIYLPNKANPGSYKIHSNYSKSTDACAACHSTHTAVGQSLLQWYTVYDACMACHDGTVSTTYNVMDGNFMNAGNNTPTFGGAFGAAQEASGSSHNVTGTVSVSAAPGGTYIKDTSWDSAFGCQSCHTPHGEGGNARILSPNPNSVNSATYYKDAISSIEFIKDGSSLIVRDSTDKIQFLLGYPNTVTLLNASNDDITVNYSIYTVGDSIYGAYTKIIPIGSSNLDNISRIFGIPVLKVRMNISGNLTADENVNHVSGINAFCGACHTDYNADIKTEYAKDTVHFNSSDLIMGDPDNRPGYSSNLFGTYSHARRHAVGLKWNYGGAANTDYIGWNDRPMSTMGAVYDVVTGYAPGSATENGLSGTGPENATYISCLTCHFAHGTSESFWKRWLDKFELYNATATVNSRQWNDDQIHEIAGSSALKRLPNMGTCEACHQKKIASEGGIYNSSLNPQALPEEETTTTDGFFNQDADTKFVGDSTCATAAIGCHQHQEMLGVNGYQKTKHGLVSSKGCGDTCHKVDPIGTLNNSNKGIGCEACHGPAGNHIKLPSSKNITNPRYQTATEQNNVCYKCHKGNKNGTYDQSVINGVYSYHTGIFEWQESKHEGTDVMSCSTCHESHKRSIEDKSLKAEYNSLCANCHLETFDLDAVMPLSTGQPDKNTRSHKFIPKITTP